VRPLYSEWGSLLIDSAEAEGEGMAGWVENPAKHQDANSGGGGAGWLGEVEVMRIHLYLHVVLALVFVL
jgi:hypothetical protein